MLNLENVFQKRTELFKCMNSRAYSVGISIWDSNFGSYVTWANVATVPVLHFSTFKQS